MGKEAIDYNKKEFAPGTDLVRIDKISGRGSTYDRIFSKEGVLVYEVGTLCETLQRTVANFIESGILVERTYPDGMEGVQMIKPRGLVVDSETTFRVCLNPITVDK